VHNAALLATDRQVVAIQADIRRPEVILGDPELLRLIDFAEPVAVLCVAVLHLIPDSEDPAGIIARFRDCVAAGSCLVLSQFAAESDPEGMAQLRAVAAGTPVETYFRTRAEIQRFFTGFHLLEPGLVEVEQWRQDTIAAPTRLKIVGGVGRKV
jgi:hypothetical protein